MWRAFLGIVISFSLGLGLSLGYTHKVDQESDRDNEKNDRKWCSLLITMDDAYQSSTPSSPVGVRVALAIHTLRNDLGC